MIIRGNINEIRPLLESYMKAYVESFKATHKKDVFRHYLVGEYKPFILAGYPGIGKSSLITETLKKYNIDGLKYDGVLAYKDLTLDSENPKQLELWMDDIFQYLAEPVLQLPIVRITYLSEDLIQKISDAGYDVHVLTFDRDLFFEWANKLSKAGHRNVDKLFLDYLKENPDDSEKDWTKITAPLSEIGVYFQQQDSTGPVPSFWGKLTTELHTHLKVGLSHRGIEMSDDEKALYESLIVDGNLDFVKIKKVLSGMPYRNDVYANKYEAFLSNLNLKLKQPYVPAHIRSAIWAKITEA